MIKNLNITIADVDQDTIDQVKSIIYSDNYFSKCNIFDCAQGDRLINTLIDTNSNFLIMELCLPHGDPYDQVKKIKKEIEDIRIMVLTQYDHRKFVKEVFMNGADAYILKKNLHNEFVECFDSLIENKPYMGNGVSIGPNRHRDINDDYINDPFLLKHRLTKRETEILNLLNQGKSTKEIASELYISDQTVSVHRKNILKKFGVRSTSTLLDMALKKSII